MGFNKSGSRFITGSYDRTCKVWDTVSGEEILTLEGHRNVVYAVAFNNPYGDKIATGSFDKTCKVSRMTVSVDHTITSCCSCDFPVDHMTIEVACDDHVIPRVECNLIST